MDYFSLIRPQYTPHIYGEKIRIVFMYQVASFWPSWETFYEECINDPRYDVKLLYINTSSVEKAQMVTAKDFLEKKQIQYVLYDDFDIEDFNPHIAVYQSPYDSSHRELETISMRLRQMGTRIIYIPYGIEITDTHDAHLAHFYSFVVRNSWRVYTLSEAMKEEYYKYCPNRRAVRALGLPKFDAYYLKKDFKISAELQNLIGGRKVVVWKMHFPKVIFDEDARYQVTPYLEDYIKFAKKIQKYSDMFFIVMPHPMFTSETIDPSLRNEAQLLLNYLSALNNVYIDYSDDYRVSLANADAVMIDRSAVMVEAAAFDIPVLYMSNPDFREPLTKPIDALVKTYYQGTNASDMESFLQLLREGKDNNKLLRRKAFQECVPFFDGECGKRIKDDIAADICRESNNDDSKINLVFFGIGKVAKYYIKKLDITNSEKYRLVAFSDNNHVMWGKFVEGIEVIEPNQLRDIDFDLIVITTEQYYIDIKKQLVYELNLDDEKIVRLDFFISLMEEMD